MLKTRVIPNGALCSAVTTYLPQWVSEGPVALKSVVSSVLGWTLQWSVTLQLSVRLRALAASSGTAWLWLNFQRSATSRVSCEQMASWINLGAFSQLTQWLMEASRTVVIRAKFRLNLGLSVLFTSVTYSQAAEDKFRRVSLSMVRKPVTDNCAGNTLGKTVVGNHGSSHLICAKFERQWGYEWPKDTLHRTGIKLPWRTQSNIQKTKRLLIVEVK